MRVPSDEYRRLDLVAHTFLRDVPLHDVSAIDLPGGGAGRSVRDVKAVTESTRDASSITRFLFWLRLKVGGVLGWDRREDRPPGEGPFRVVYQLSDETLSEVRNATVHAFLCSTLVPRGDGYRLYWAVYVEPVSRWTRLYMAAIEPFRRFIVYPNLLRGVRRAWIVRYGGSEAPAPL